MATNIAWTWQVGSVIIAQENLISFYGANYGDPIKIGEYQKSTHVRKSWTEDTQIDTGGNELYNFAYISDTEVSVNGSYPIVLSGNSPTSGKGIKITLRDTGNQWAFKVLGVKIFAFTGGDMTVPVNGCDINFFEFGQDRWHRLYGSTNAAVLSPRLTTSTRHTWEVAISIKPTEIINKTATIRLEADIQ